MKKRYLVIFVIILLIMSLTIGCKRKPGVDAEEGPEKIYRGTKGLAMEFLRNMPPSKLYDTTPLTILLELENKGTYDLSGNKCRLYLSGFDDTIIRGLDKDKMCASSLEGKSILNPEGGYNTQQFSTDIIRIPDYLDSLPQKIMITACYEYQTTASPIVCVDPRLYEIGPVERACTVKDVTTAGGQGAPIAVSGVNVEMAGRDRVAFNIKVSNVGGGTPLYLGASVFRDCPYSIDPKDYNIISYDVEMSGSTKVRCSPEIEGDERIRLVDGKGTIFCTFRITGDSAYTTPLRIVLDYNYMDSISKDIEIIKTPE
ncbi:hypothetical protein GOV06_03035 [Candidatus Woesearchaeota archaeon]|nr:hypothetical protein [Candidatus Woesearchaeota archaeon]